MNFMIRRGNGGGVMGWRIGRLRMMGGWGNVKWVGMMLRLRRWRGGLRMGSMLMVLILQRSIGDLSLWMCSRGWSMFCLIFKEVFAWECISLFLDLQMIWKLTSLLVFRYGSMRTCDVICLFIPRFLYSVYIYTVFVLHRHLPSGYRETSNSTLH